MKEQIIQRVEEALAHLRAQGTLPAQPCPPVVMGVGVGGTKDVNHPCQGAVKSAAHVHGGCG